jgi:ATP-binding cassette subfamily F protein 3
MIAVNNLTISFSGRYLFDGINFNINPGDRIGLIGRNGSGKSTMLKLIAGLESPEEGTISKPNGYNIGYLPQEGIVESDLNIYDETMSAMGNLLTLEDQIKELTEDISSRNDYDSKEYISQVHKLTELNDRFNILGGHSVEADVEKILTGLGFSRNDFYRLCSEFSGGWQMRIELAKLLLRKPEAILLDEPTNHLDIESIQWLEDYIRAYSGAIVIVSHDRNFLNSATNRTIEIAAGKIFDMNVSYNQFIDLREEQRIQQLNAYRNQQQQIKETEKFIERFRYKSTLASRVQSRVKQLDKIERIELDEEDNSSLNLRFPEPPRAGRMICEASRLTKKYSDNLVLDNIEFDIDREDKIAFVGKNGEGKSTLARILAGREEFDGKLTMGYNVQVGYYAQHQAELLNGNDTVLDVIDQAATGEMRTKIRTLLGAFLFRGDDVYKKVKVLSGGEKSRLALAKMLLQPVNFLILDEPTNHLDMPAKDVLKHALLQFKGAIVIVSHDRDFLDGLTTKVIQFKEKQISQHLAGIYEFLEKQKLQNLQELEITKNTSFEDRNFTQGKDKLARESQKARQRELNKMNKLIQTSESEIHEIENKIGELEEFFSKETSYEFNPDLKDKHALYDKLRLLLDEKLLDWEELHIQYESSLNEKETRNEDN